MDVQIKQNERPGVLWASQPNTRKVNKGAFPLLPVSHFPNLSNKIEAHYSAPGTARGCQSWLPIRMNYLEYFKKYSCLSPTQNQLDQNL